METLWFVKAYYIEKGKKKMYSHIHYNETSAYLEYNLLKESDNYFDVSIEAKLF